MAIIVKGYTELKYRKKRPRPQNANINSGQRNISYVLTEYNQKQAKALLIGRAGKKPAAFQLREFPTQCINTTQHISVFLCFFFSLPFSFLFWCSISAFDHETQDPTHQTKSTESVSNSFASFFAPHWVLLFFRCLFETFNMTPAKFFVWYLLYMWRAYGHFLSVSLLRVSIISSHSMLLLPLYSFRLFPIRQHNFGL